ncbi:hypothetical protein BVG16_29450 [Paenibacillus selenitireducens]|uniref:Uncharacterized protein n=2 Tax=Paenibacillus selenitireducens TaxID=1324314 RepID=A0A1T2X0N0_9BACL|nr:hypothetical protein BVG16_29450 [Paenibacillus selenitireducens]
MSDNVSFEKPLRSVEPALYGWLQSEMSRLHIHPYDVHAGAEVQSDGVLVRLRFGERLSYVQEQHFSRDAIESQSLEINRFFAKVGEDIQKALVSDYFKMMKP